MMLRCVSKLLPGCGLEGILDSRPPAIFLKNKSLRYTWCNTQFEQFCGCPRADISGKTAADFLDRIHAETAAEADLAVLNTHERQVYDGQVTCPCGQLIDVRFLKIPAISRDGETVGIIGVAIDTSSYRVTERQLLRNLSHMTEVNTSLERFAGDLQSSLAYTEDQASRLAELAEQIETQKQSIAE